MANTSFAAIDVVQERVAFARATYVGGERHC
jgi:hypothetical protein